jgi:hypothetical protein
VNLLNATRVAKAHLLTVNRVERGILRLETQLATLIQRREVVEIVNLAPANRAQLEWVAVVVTRIFRAVEVVVMRMAHLDRLGRCA